MLANNSGVLIAVTQLPLRWNAVRSLTGCFSDEIRGGTVIPGPRHIKGSNGGVAVWRLHVLPRVCPPPAPHIWAMGDLVTPPGRH